MSKPGLLERLKQHLFQSTGKLSGQWEDKQQEQHILAKPEAAQAEELTRRTDSLTLLEQLAMIRTVDAYLHQFEAMKMERERTWDKGFFIYNEVFVTESDVPVYRSNIEVFFQEAATGEKKVSYLVSLVKFGEEDWRVFQVKDLACEWIIQHCKDHGIGTLIVDAIRR